PPGPEPRRPDKGVYITSTSSSQPAGPPASRASLAPITTPRLCKVVANFLDRDAILCVDGHVTLNWGRQIIPTYAPAHRLNCGPFGCIGVGVPFGLGAKVARPDKQVLVLQGDGGFGFNGMEMDTAVRNNIPIVVVVNNNASWETLVKDRKVPGQYLGHSNYDKMAEALGCHGERVERPQDIRPALERAFKAGVPALINVITDPYCEVHTQEFYGY
ncbi:MAG: thiamine pyrophosphate-dependent enzyme, partial [Chloroflexota bacterium]